MWELIGKMAALLLGSFLGAMFGSWMGSIRNVPGARPGIARRIETKLGAASRRSAVYVPQMTPEERQALDEPERRRFFGGFAPPAEKAEEEEREQL